MVNFTKNNQVSKQGQTSTFMRLLVLTKPYLKGVILAIICVLLVNLAELVKPIILKVVIDEFLVNQTAQEGWFSLKGMGSLYFMTVLAGGCFSICQANLINRVSQSIMKSLRARVFYVIQYLPLKKLDHLSSGRLITRATNDVEAINEMYTDVLINLFKDIFLIIGIIYMMLSLNVELALVSLMVIPFMILWVFGLKKKIKDNFTKMKYYIGQINGFMSENISGMKVVQLYRGEEMKLKQFLELNEKYFQTTWYQVRLNAILRPATEVFQTLAVVILLAYSLHKISNLTLEIGVLYAFTTYIKQFFRPISELAENYTTIQSALVSADRIFELLDQEVELEDIKEGETMACGCNTIEFKNVWFAYSGEDWVLKNVSFQLTPGQTVAFIGETGAGKTTIISLISGFYPVNKGVILIDGKNINDYKLEDLRRKVVVVLQDVFLFSGNVRDNITLNDEIDESIIEEAIRVSCADTFIQQLPHQLEEPVMERGNTFSQGQKQLLSFARAIAHEPSVLVLDEATANIDTQTEKVIQLAIENVSKDRTTLIIAHRLSTIKEADQIIVLKRGCVAEQGNHEQLLLKGGYYTALIEAAKQNIEILN